MKLITTFVPQILNSVSSAQLSPDPQICTCLQYVYLCGCMYYINLNSTCSKESSSSPLSFAPKQKPKLTFPVLSVFISDTTIY